MKIKRIKAREIVDSRGSLTIEVSLETNRGWFLSSVPSGASCGRYEAKKINSKLSVNRIEKIIAPKLIGKDPRKQKQIDDLLIKLDNSPDKSKLGANSLLGVSLAVCRAGAYGKPLYLYISKLINGSLRMPKPLFNIINGGAHAKSNLDIQEFMICPKCSSFSKSLYHSLKTYHGLKKIIEDKNLNSAVGDEGGFVPDIKNTTQALDLIVKADSKSDIFLDAAASEFFSKDIYHLDGKKYSAEKLSGFYNGLIAKYPISSIEDPFSENDWQAWQGFSINQKILVVADDLTTTNPKRIKMAYEKKACNAIIIKPNQIGTVSETLQAVLLAKRFGFKIIASHRSGETNDDFLADLSVGIASDFIKTGAPARGERVAKYNRLLQIEKELK